MRLFMIVVSEAQSAQSGRNGPAGGTDGRRHTTHDAHQESEKQAPKQQNGGYPEGEREVRERLPVHRAGGEAVQRQRGKATQRTAQKGDEQRFDDKRQHYTSRAEAQGPHRGDFPRAFSDRRIHGIQRAARRSSRSALARFTSKSSMDAAVASRSALADSRRVRASALSRVASTCPAFTRIPSSANTAVTRPVILAATVERRRGVT